MQIRISRIDASERDEMLHEVRVTIVLQNVPDSGVEILDPPDIELAAGTKGLPAPLAPHGRQQRFIGPAQHQMEV